MARVPQRGRRGAPTSAVLDGLLAGAGATAALSALERAESILLRRQPVYAPQRLASRILGRERGARLLGAGLRGLYGPFLGVAWRVAPGWRRLSPPWNGLAAGTGTFLFEALAMPRLGATPPFRTWSRGEQLGLLAQTLAFGLVLSRLLMRACLVKVSANRRAE